MRAYLSFIYFWFVWAFIPAYASPSSRAELYREQEINYTKAYIERLNANIDQAFEKQLEHFEEEELGFWASYSNMLSLFKSNEDLQREWSLKGDKYFNPISVRALYHELFLEYQQTIQQYRQNFSTEAQLPAADYFDLHVPGEQVDLAILGQYSLNNVWIELLGWLFDVNMIVWVITTIGAILGLCGVITPPNWVGWLVMVIGIILGCVLSIINDCNLMNSLREQREQNPSINTELLEKRLLENINTFYANK